MRPIWLSILKEIYKFNLSFSKLFDKTGLFVASRIIYIYIYIYYTYIIHILYIIYILNILYILCILYIYIYICAMWMFDLYIMYIFIGDKVNHTSSKNARQENPSWRELIIYIKCIALFFANPHPLNIQTVHTPLFREFPPIYCFFVITLPLNLHHIKLFHF